MTELANAALEYANLGLRVCRVRAGHKAPPDTNWPDIATNNPDTVRQWWTQKPDANIGLAFGPQPAGHNLFAIDIDRKLAADGTIDPDKDGTAQYRALVAKHGPLPATWTVVSRLGRHMCFTAPAAVTIHNQQGKGNTIAPNIDVRGHGGYTVLPPSVHPDGGNYRWAAGLSPADLEPAPAPGWLLDLLNPHRCPNCGSTNTQDTP